MKANYISELNYIIQSSKVSVIKSDILDAVFVY